MLPYRSIDAGVAGQDAGRAIVLGDDGRALDSMARPQRGAAIKRYARATRRWADVDPPFDLGRAFGLAEQRQSGLRRPARNDHPQGDDLNLGVWVGVAVKPLDAERERLRRWRSISRRVSHDLSSSGLQFERLAAIAHFGRQTAARRAVVALLLAAARLRRASEARSRPTQAASSSHRRGRNKRCGRNRS